MLKKLDKRMLVLQMVQKVNKKKRIKYNYEHKMLYGKIITSYSIGIDRGGIKGHYVNSD